MVSGGQGRSNVLVNELNTAMTRFVAKFNWSVLQKTLFENLTIASVMAGTTHLLRPFPSLS